MKTILAFCLSLTATWAAASPAQLDRKDDKKGLPGAPDGLKALKHTDPKVRYNSAELLLRLGPVAKFAAPALHDALRDSDGRVRMKVAEALWNIERTQPRVLLPVLVDGLKESDPAVRINALAVLGQMGKAAKPAVPSIVARGLRDKDMEVRTEAVVALGEIGPAARDAVPALLDALKGDELRLLESLVAASLGNIGEPAVPTLVKTLADADAARRRTAAYALALIGPKAAEAAPALTKALTDTEGEVRAPAARALGKIGPEAKPAAGALSKALTDADPFVRVRAALALWQVDGRGTGVPVLREALKAKEDRVREQAAESLGELGAKAALAGPALEAALRDASPQVRRLAAEALGKIGLAGELKAPLGMALKDEDEGVRLSAARVLWAVTPAKERADLVEGVIQALGSRSASLRKRAAVILGDFGADAKPAVVALLGALREPDAGVRQAAAAALRRIDPAAAARAGVE
jgi:HEAT repeat protein